MTNYVVEDDKQENNLRQVHADHIWNVQLRHVIKLDTYVRILIFNSELPEDIRKI